MIAGIIGIVALVFFILIIAIINKNRNAKKEQHFSHLSEAYQFELFKSNSFFKGTKFELKGEFEGHQVRVHEETTGSGKHQIRYTIWTIECKNLDFQFSIGKENFLTRLGNWMGFKDIEFRDEEIDRAFRFKSDNEDRFRSLMNHELLYELSRIKDNIKGALQYKHSQFSYRMPQELLDEKKRRDFESVLPVMIKIINSRTFH